MKFRGGEFSTGTTGNFQSELTVAQHVLVTVLSLPPRRSVMTLRSAHVMSCCLRPEGEGSASGSKFCFEATCGFTFVAAR